MLRTLTRRDAVFAVLAAFFLTNAILAELIGGKLIVFGSASWTLYGQPLKATAGVFLWPVVFVTTDLINEYFGKRGVRRITLLSALMIAWVFLALRWAMSVPALHDSPVTDASFNNVFGTGQWIIVGSLTAFLVSQLVDVVVFHWLRRRTGARWIWVRTTGSTVVSQVLDSVVVIYIGLAIPFGWSFEQFLQTAIPNYLIKLSLAILMTPLIYLVHGAVERYLGRDLAHELSEAAARESGD
jgi:queuosine precursor transporter